jgi:hypothetical protein
MTFWEETMKNKLHIITVIIGVILTISISFNIVLAVNNVSAEPGSDQDPLVSKSYVDSLIEKYNNEINTLKAEIDKLKTESNQSVANGFETVSIKANQKVMTGKGSEIIFKTGKATVVKGKNGALTDINLAKDLSTGSQIALNHLIISSQNDGRGFKTSTQCWVLIKGAYNIEESASGVTNDNDKDNSKGETGGTETKDNVSTAGKGKVIASSLNMRADKNTTSNIVGKLVKDEEVTIVSKSGDWIKVKNLKGITGWVMGKYIKQ